MIAQIRVPRLILVIIKSIVIDQTNIQEQIEDIEIIVNIIGTSIITVLTNYRTIY